MQQSDFTQYQMFFKKFDLGLPFTSLFFKLLENLLFNILKAHTASQILTYYCKKNNYFKLPCISSNTVYYFYQKNNKTVRKVSKYQEKLENLSWL